jgi:hypothetical protein
VEDDEGGHDRAEAVDGVIAGFCCFGHEMSIREALLRGSVAVSYLREIQRQQQIPFGNDNNKAKATTVG